jgi:hypothetical protein
VAELAGPARIGNTRAILGRIIHGGRWDMPGRKQIELEPPRKLKVRTIQTVRFGKSKVNIKLADKTLRKLMRERENKEGGAITK